MNWFQKLSQKAKKAAELFDTKLSADATDEEKLKRVHALTKEQQQVYQYLRQGFSMRWISETIGVSRTRLMLLERDIYRVLGVANLKSLILLYGKLGLSPTQVIDF